ncbi:MAG: chemotaxis protein CheW [Pseudomonadota bacterium]
MIDPNQDQIALADTSVAGAQAAAGAPETMLVMRLAGEAFAVPVAEVDEIVDPIDETTVPGAPRHAPSLVNVRGAIAPVIDIRSRLGMGPRGERASGARMIVLEVQQGGLLMRLAIEAEAVEEVAEIDLAALMPLPEQGASWPPELVRGVARLDGGLIIVLDTHALFAPSEIVGERGTQTDMARAV